jgi:hypothetical protein
MAVSTISSGTRRDRKHIVSVLSLSNPEIRGLVCYLGVRVFGYKGLESGKMLYLGGSGVSIAARRGVVFLRGNPARIEKILTIIDK